MNLVPVSQREARRFIADHHRHNVPPRGDLFRVGLEIDGQLVAVAVAGRPNAPALQDGHTFEVTRVCTLGTRNACSRLYGALNRAGAALGYRRSVTYTLEHEAGVSPAASGYQLDAVLVQRDWALESGRDKYTENLLGERVAPEGRRLRWVRDL